MQDIFENVPKVLEIILLPLYPVLMVMEIAYIMNKLQMKDRMIRKQRDEGKRLKKAIL